MLAKLPEWKVTAAQKQSFSPLIKLIGERVTATKVSERAGNTFKDIQPIYTGTGYLQLYDRGGGLSFFIGSINDWFASSWVKEIKKTAVGVEVTTENSIYLLRTGPNKLPNRVKKSV